MMDDFWLFIIKWVQEQIIVYVLDKCEEEGCMENFLIVGGKLEGVIWGVMFFDDIDLYKIIEGVFNFLISVFNLELECMLDILIDIIVVGQEVDGYFIIWWIIDLAKLLVFWVKVIDGKCWELLEVSYEMYNFGYLYEVVYMYYIVIGKINFLDIVLKNVDLMVKIFGDGEGQISIVFGYQIIEIGFIKLYMVSGVEKYFYFVKYFFDNWGNLENYKFFGLYLQDY